MGWLQYAGTALPIEDRALAHLRAVLRHKLQLREHFLLKWRVAPRHGSGRLALWCGPETALVFRFESQAPIHLNTAWVEQMLAASYISGGVDLADEPPSS